MAFKPLNLCELIKAVQDSRNRWFAEYLVYSFISVFRGRQIPINLRDFNKLDEANRELFVKILHVRCDNGWSYEELYQTERALKEIIGIS